MHQVRLQLTDQLYDQAKRRAVEAGFKSMDEYIADVVSDELTDDADNLDHLFTPERLAKIDAAAAQVEAGQFLTSEQADVELAKHRAEWLQNNEL